MGAQIDTNAFAIKPMWVFWWENDNYVGLKLTDTC